MNAPAAPAAMQTSALPLDQITPSNTHIQLMRRERFSAPLLQDLARSISEIGVLQAIVVRPAGGVNAGRFELVAGERRWLAARIAGLATIPATVRDLTDEQVLKAQLVENLQREGLHPLEEAEGYDELMKLEKITADQVAEMVGKSRSYVFARLKLLALGIDARHAFYAGEIDASRALYIARIATPALQAKALKMAKEKRYDGEPNLSVRGLREALTGDDFSVRLSTAPFALDDVSFFEEIKVAKGKVDQRQLPACHACPHYTGNCLDLFSQDDDPNVCMEPICFKLKVKQHSARLREQAISQGAPIITDDAAKKILPGKDKSIGYVDLDSLCDDDEPQLPDLKRKDYPSDEAFEEAEEAQTLQADRYQARSFRQILAGETVPTVLVEDPKTKAIRTMAPVAEVKKALAAKKISFGEYRYKEQPTFSHLARTETDEMKREREEQARRQHQETAFRRAVLQQVFDKWNGPLKRQELLGIADQWLENAYFDEGDPLLMLYGGKEPEPAKMKDPELVRLIAMLTVADCAGPYGAPKPLLDLARRLKIDPDKIKKELRAAEKTKAAPEKKPAAKKAKKS